MLNNIRNFFSKPQPIPEPPASLTQLADASIFVISATVSEGIDASTMTSDQLLAEIKRAIERDKENQNGYGVFIYSEAGKRRLPFFTTHEHAKRFCATYSNERNRVFPFMVLQVQGTMLGKFVQLQCDAVVMNDKSADVRVLSEDEMSAARRTWGN